MTVGELMAFLAAFPTDLPVMALYDDGCAGGAVVRVVMGPSPEDNTDAVIVVVE